MAGYIGNQAQIRSGLSATIDELNIIDGVTATTAELNILDGVTSTATELNILDGVTATTAELNIMDGVTATTAELNIMDGVTATAAEINLIDGGTARGTTAIVDADGVLINDAGTMRMTTVATLATYMGTKIGGGMEFIASSGELSSAATVSFTGFDSSKYDSYVFNLYYVKPATDAQKLYAYASTNGGGAYDSTSGNYKQSAVNDTAAFSIHPSDNAGNNTNEYGVYGSLTITKPHASAYTSARAATSVYTTNNYLYTGADGDAQSSAYRSTSEVNAVQFKFGSGNIASGEITMFGIVNS